MHKAKIKHQKDNIHNSQAIIEKYITTLQELSDFRKTMTTYPALVYPQSLLPDPKPVIAEAIHHAKEEAFLKKDYQLVQLLDWGLTFLDHFIDDLAATEENGRVFVRNEKKAQQKRPS